MSKRPQFRADQMPEITSSAFLEMTPVDKAHEKMEPTREQLDDLFQRPAFRFFMALVKRRALDTKDRFFSGVGIPAALESASPREAYFTALVNSGREVLDLQRQVWDDACEREQEVPDEEEKVEPEENPFGPEPITEFSS